MEKRFRSAARTFLGGFLKDSARIIKPSQGIYSVYLHGNAFKHVRAFKQALTTSMQISDGLRKIHFGIRHFSKSTSQRHVKYKPECTIFMYIFRFKGFKVKLTNK